MYILAPVANIPSGSHKYCQVSIEGLLDLTFTSSLA
jgi:hypothetical protein